MKKKPKEKWGKMCVKKWNIDFSLEHSLSQLDGVRLM
jgi:hypothetical protein